MGEINLITKILIFAVPILFAITVHEVAHGWVAYKNGDKTAWLLGRLTLNPIKHIDPIGTILVPAFLAYQGGFIFGWAKPVPVTYQNLRNPKRDMALVAAAGPFSNLIMALIWALIMKLSLMLYFTGTQSAEILVNMGYIGIRINVLLMILNLIPIPPLDGSRVVSSFLPPKLAWKYSRIEPYGIFVIFGLIFVAFSFGIGLPFVGETHRFIASLFGLPG